MIFQIAFGGFFVLALWLAIFMRWQRGLYWLLVYLPYAGVVSLALYPNPAPLLFKDIFFVIPVYLSFFLFNSGQIRKAPIPLGVVLAIFFLGLMVLVQSMNPNLINWMVAAVGAKVWLFYIPLIFIAATAIDSTRTLINVLRLLLALAVVPCALGLAEWFLSVTIGYRTTMTAIYGAAAASATQGFASFSYGGSFVRIPSTFTFGSQYGGFILSMLAPAYALMRLDPSPRWRRFAAAVLLLLIVSAILSGSRGGALFMSLMVGLIAVLDGRLSTVLAWILILPVVILVTLDLGGLDPLTMFQGTAELTSAYLKSHVVGAPLEALANNPWGLGTGMNTNPARHVAPLGALVGAESYYAKAINEMGVLGLLAVIGVFLSVIFAGLRCLRTIRDRGLGATAAAFVAFFILMPIRTLKGWPLDIDPINVYFWVFAGILFKLPYLKATAQSIGPARIGAVVRRAVNR